MTGNRGWSATPLSPFRVAYVEGSYRYRSPYRHLDDDAYIAASVDDLRQTLATATSGEIACLLAEPIQGVGGFTLGPRRPLGGAGRGGGRARRAVRVRRGADRLGSDRRPLLGLPGPRGRAGHDHLRQGHG